MVKHDEQSYLHLVKHRMNRVTSTWTDVMVKHRMNRATFA